MAPQLTVVSAERIAEELRKLLAHPSRPAGLALLHEAELLPHALPGMTAGLVPACRVLKQLPTAAGFEVPFAALHDGVSPPDLLAACKRLKLSNHEADRIVWLAAHRRTLADAGTLPPSRLYPVLAHPGAKELVALHRADGFGPAADFCERLLREKSPADLDPPPLVTGDDLRRAGFQPGPGFKPALAAARAAQLDGQATTPADALAVALRHLG
jgi:poly(A) polymerase